MRSLRFVLALLVLALAAVAFAQGTADGDRPECVTARGVVIAQAYGYNHLVHVENHCAESVTCRVSTDVNPQVNEVRLTPGQSTDVSTFLGSPASAFRARVECPNAGPPRMPHDRGE
jgi:hypothetical protein